TRATRMRSMSSLTSATPAVSLIRPRTWIRPSIGCGRSCPGLVDSIGLGCRGLTGSSACRKPPPFKLDRTEVPKSRVAASSVIEHLDVVEDSGSKLHPCHPSLPVEKFCLQRSEETLCHRIV